MRLQKAGHDLGTEQQQQNRSNIVANLIKTLKMVHIKIFFKKSQQKMKGR